jgi:CRISPR-associated protein Csx17
MPEIILPGCTPQPLANYLKALGVLRLVVEQNLDPNAKGYWSDDTFVLHFHLSQNDLVQFFLEDYQPTPLVSPWNGSTGFYEKDNQKTLQAILNALSPRFAAYRETVCIAQQQVLELKLTAQPKDKDKALKKQLLARLRNRLPDAAVRWLDACAVLAGFELKFPPLLGTGGNDGNFDFSRTFMQQLQELLDFQTGQPKENAFLLLNAALFGCTVPGLTFAGKIGQFNPIAAGGTNAAPGHYAPPRVNPWDYVLMLEGSLLFTSSATRRYEHSAHIDFAYPFTVRPSRVGYGSASEADDIRAELWVPLWSRPTGLRELQLFFNEGRATVAGRTALYGIDFAFFISMKGETRLISEYIRYSFQVRNGDSYFAVPLGRIAPKFNPQVNLLVELDTWLLNLRRTVSNAKAPSSLKRTYYSLETILYQFSQGKKQLLDVLIALAEMEAACDRSLKFIHDKSLPPVPLLSDKWIHNCNDSSPEFRLALALAGNGLRQRSVRVRFQNRYPTWVTVDDGITTWQQGSLVNNLIALLKRASIEAQRFTKQQESNNSQRDSPMSANLAFPKAHLDDIVCFINGEVDDVRIISIARGLALVNICKQSQRSRKPNLPIPAAYAFVAISYHRTIRAKALQDIKAIEMEQPDLTLPRVPALLYLLEKGDCVAATKLAAMRLRASGLNPAIREGIYEPRVRTQRIAAALAFPLLDVDIARLLKLIRRFDLKG